MIFSFFLFTFIVLSALGGKPVEYPYLIVSRFFTFFYFFYFFYIIYYFFILNSISSFIFCIRYYKNFYNYIFNFKFVNNNLLRNVIKKYDIRNFIYLFNFKPFIFFINNRILYFLNSFSKKFKSFVINHIHIHLYMVDLFFDRFSKKFKSFVINHIHIHLYMLDLFSETFHKKFCIKISKILNFLKIKILAKDAPKVIKINVLTVSDFNN